jgi:hypothetical protein
MSIVEPLSPSGLTKPSSPPRVSPTSVVGPHVERLCLHEASIRWGDEWEEFLRSHGTGTPSVWPEAISEETRQPSRSGQIKSQCLGMWEGSSLRGLALLPGKMTARRTLLTPFPWDRLQGMRLAGNQIFTDGREETLSGLMDEVGRELRRQKARFLLIEDLETNTPLHREIQRLQRQGFHWCWDTEPQPRFRIRMPETAEQYWGTFSSKSRYNLRRQDRRMEETKLVCFTTPEQVGTFLEQAAHVSRNSWQQERIGTRIRNDDHEQRHLRSLAAKGHLHCYVLMQRSDPAAFLLGMRDERTFYYEEIGYDRNYAEYSPGTVLLFKAINHLYETNRVEWFDFGFGDAPYKRLFANHRTESGKGWLLPPGLSAWELHMTFKACKLSQRWGRALLARLGWLQKLRQQSRRGGNKTSAVSPSSPEEG